MDSRGINPAHATRLLTLEREVSRLRADLNSRNYKTAASRRPIVRWAKTVAEEATPYPLSGTVFPFVFVQRTFNESTGAVTDLVLGDEMAPAHKLKANEYIAEGSFLPVVEIDGQWWRHDETGGAEVAKIVKLTSIAKPAYEVNDSGTYTQFAPTAVASSYAHDSDTGELSLAGDSLSVVNLAQRSYGLSGASRAECVLAVPIEGSKRVLVPLANDPYVPFVSLEYLPISSGGVSLEVESEGTHKTTWIQQDLFTPLSFGRLTPLDNDESFPLFARPHRSGLYICKPGKYLIVAGVIFSMGSLETNYGSPKVLTTSGASAGTAHTHTYEADGPWGQLAMQVRANLHTAATPSLTPFYPDSFQHVHLPTFYENESSGEIEVATSFVIAPAPGFITRYNLMAAFKSWNFDPAGSMPSIKIKGAYIRAFPISDYIHGQSVPTDVRHAKQYNPYSTGSFIWHTGIAAPILWNKDGAAV